MPARRARRVHPCVPFELAAARVPPPRTAGAGIGRAVATFASGPTHFRRVKLCAINAGAAVETAPVVGPALVASPVQVDAAGARVHDAAAACAAANTAAAAAGTGPTAAPRGRRGRRAESRNASIAGASPGIVRLRSTTEGRSTATTTARRKSDPPRQGYPRQGESESGQVHGGVPLSHDDTAVPTRATCGNLSVAALICATKRRLGHPQWTSGCTWRSSLPAARPSCLPGPKNRHHSSA